MEPIILKILSAFILWTISICFGVVFPYCIWKISPHESRHREVEREVDNSDQGDDELDNLIMGHSRSGGRHTRIFGVCRRFASCMRVRFTNGKFLSLVNCLCGGVFLGVSLLDLIPQSRTAVSLVLVQTETVTNYPVAEFTVSLGLLLVMIVENLVTSFISENARKEDSIGRSSDSASSDQNDDIIEGSSAGGSNHVRIKDNVSIYRMYVLVITLSLHAVFEGLAIGLQNELSTILQLVIAISVHKAVLSFGIGLPLFETLGNSRKIPTAVACALIFCSASPIGCVIAAFVSTDAFSNSSGALIAGAILQCLATGTFLYVTFVEMIPREFSHHAKDYSAKGAKQPPNILHTHMEESNDSAMEDLCDTPSEHSIHIPNADHTGRSFKGADKHQKRSQIMKLLALVIGFSIASVLQLL